MPDIGYKRYVLQCVIPDGDSLEGKRCPVTLKIRGPGGKSIAQGLFVGYFQYRPNGIPRVVLFANRRWNFENLRISREYGGTEEMVGRQSAGRCAPPFAGQSSGTAGSRLAYD
jgi:hypothetical protein